MTDPAPETKNAPAAPEPTAPKGAAKTVTSTKTVDFPALGWGINAGETRELPADKDAQATILSRDFITLTK